MATKAELQRKINDLEGVIREAESASRTFRDQARVATKDSEKQRLNREAEQKDKFVSGVYTEVSGLRQYLRDL